MTSRLKPNELERQSSCNRIGFHSRLQTIMEVDSSSNNQTPSGDDRKQTLQRGIKRPLMDMTLNTQSNEESHSPMSPHGAIVSVRRCCCRDNLVAQYPCSSFCRPAKRPAANKSCAAATAVASTAHGKHLRCRVESLPSCPTNVPKGNMKPTQVVPSVGGVSKLIRNQVKPVPDDQRAMHKQLHIEHLQLQRSFALWRQLVEEARSHKDNEELASWAEEKAGILKSTKKLQDKVDELQEKLTEYREQNELLEFRILELDHCQSKQCPPCGEPVTTLEINFCTTGCTQAGDPCFRLFQDQVALYQDLEIKADELLEELRLLSAQPGLSCVHRSALVRSAVCVNRCKKEVVSAIGLLPVLSGGQQKEQQVLQTTQNQALFLGSDWLEKVLFGGGRLRSLADKSMEENEPEFLDQISLQETSMTESEIGQSLVSEWPVTLVQPSNHKTTEQQISEDEGLGEDSRRSTEPNSLVSEDLDAKLMQTAIEDLRKRNSSLKLELRQAEILVRTFKLQADRVQDLENQLSRTEREKSEYQEQILELEEAENDARLESQTLRALVENLRQHENDLEQNLCETRNRLEECEQCASAAGTTAEELRTQVRYLEELVYKYEEHIQGLEQAESELRQKLLETKKSYADVETQVTDNTKEFLDVSVQVHVEEAHCKCPQKKDLLARLQSLEEKDGVLREQLHQVDGLNLKLWQKLYCLETDIGECKRQEGSWGPEQHHREATARSVGLLDASNTSLNNNTSFLEDMNSEGDIGDRLQVLECNEKKLREQLLQQERINQDFEQALEVRERLNRDKEREQSQWLEREKELKSTIKDLENERVSLREQTVRLEKERTCLKDSLEQLQQEYGRLKLTHCQETQDLHVRHQEASRGMQDTGGVDEEDLQKVIRLSREAFQIRSEQEELRTHVVEMSLAFETELRALRACHELEERRLHDEIMSVRCRDDQCCSKVQELAIQRERLEISLADREQQLEKLATEFKRKSDAMEEERTLFENELQTKMKEMEESTAIAVQELEEKRRQLETNLRADMEDLRCKENTYKIRIRDLERHVDCLRNEITSLAQGIESEEYTSEENLEYQHQIEELEKKEAAYVETLQNADKIISQMELRYRDNIQRLEGSERSLQERIVQLETTEAELRSALHNERRYSDSGRVTELLRELMDAEARENALKDHVDEMEISYKSLLLKVRELERTNQQISEELQNHEEASISAEDLRCEQERLKDEISQLKRSEAALKETLTHADAILAQREHLLADRVAELEIEKQGSDEMVHQLREHVKTLQEQLDQAQFQSTPGSRESAGTEVNREEISDLKLEVFEIEKLIRNPSWLCGETKETQTERKFFSKSRSVTAPVSPISSLCDLSNLPTTNQEKETMRRREDLEDASYLGMEERMELEHCMKRAMAAMERDLQMKVFNQEEVEEEDEERIRIPASPACSSTSGCESDCSSSGGSCRWPGPTALGKSRPTGLDLYESDDENGPQEPVQRHTVTSRELPTLMKTRIIFPSITKTEVKEMPTLITRHSEYPTDDTDVENDHSLPDAPGNFCILRRVGHDSLLLGWTPPASNITSYQILVDGEVQQRVRSPDRTKALLHKLDLTRPHTISIQSLAAGGTQPNLLESASRPAILRFDPMECQ